VPTVFAPLLLRCAGASSIKSLLRSWSFSWNSVQAISSAVALSAACTRPTYSIFFLMSDTRHVRGFGGLGTRPQEFGWPMRRRGSILAETESSVVSATRASE
jgi:hypothetical protein